MAGKLKVFVSVDGVQYGPEEDIPADVAKKIDNPDVWAEAKNSPKSKAAEDK